MFSSQRFELQLEGFDDPQGSEQLGLVSLKGGAVGDVLVSVK